MIEIEEIIILNNVPLTTNYQYTLENNMTQFNTIDFFIYVKNATNINSIQTVVEYSGKLNPSPTDWARISIENFDSDAGIFNLIDYITNREISEPCTYSIRCRSQGRLMRLGIKANAPGGLITVGLLRKKNK